MKNFSEVEEFVEGFCEKFLYNNGIGKDIEIREFV